MDRERWQRLSPLLDALVELGDEARAARLAGLRTTDPSTAAELEALLGLGAAHADFLARPLLPWLPATAPGAAVGPYRLEHMLGEGGMGQVWLASRADGLYERRVALKLLRPGLADPRLQQRFARERQILARLEHPNIARFIDAGISDDGQPYLALEYVEAGQPITDWCRTRAPPLVTRLQLFLQVCDAVSHAHANLIVHRDLKPSNILVTPQEEVRLLDFGIAKLLGTSGADEDGTRTGARAFTLHYAAPEQVRGEPVTTMTDVYSLGVVLYGMLSGCKPYRLDRDSDGAWEAAILDDDPPRPSAALLQAAGASGSAARQQVRREARRIAGDLDNIVLKAMAKRPLQRYPSVEAMAQDIRRHLAGQAVRARPRGLLYLTRKYVGRHRWVLAAGAGTTIVLAAALAVVAWQAREATQQAARAHALQGFMIGLFESAGTVPGESLDLSRLLDDGLRRGEVELAGQPLVLAELLGVIARLRAGLGDHAQALELHRRQAALVAGIDRAPAALRLQAAIGMGQTQQRLGQAADCITRLRPLRPLALREEERQPLLAAQFHTQLGRCQRDRGDLEAAHASFQRALAIHSAEPASAVGQVEGMFELAVLRAAGNEPELALAELQAALSLLRARAGPRHPLEHGILRAICVLQDEAAGRVPADADCPPAAPGG